MPALPGKRFPFFSPCESARSECVPQPLPHPAPWVTTLPCCANCVPCAFHSRSARVPFSVQAVIGPRLHRRCGDIGASNKASIRESAFRTRSGTRVPGSIFARRKCVPEKVRSGTQFWYACEPMLMNVSHEKRVPKSAFREAFRNARTVKCVPVPR